MEQVASDKGAGLPEVWQTYQTVINSAVETEVNDQHKHFSSANLKVNAHKLKE